MAGEEGCGKMFFFCSKSILSRRSPPRRKSSLWEFMFTQTKPSLHLGDVGFSLSSYPQFFCHVKRKEGGSGRFLLPYRLRAVGRAPPKYHCHGKHPPLRHGNSTQIMTRCTPSPCSQQRSPVLLPVTAPHSPMLQGLSQNHLRS